MHSHDEAIERFLAAVRDGDRGSAAAALKQSPAIASADLFTACCVADPEAVAKALADDPARARAERGPRGWTALNYLCQAVDTGARDAERAEAARRCGVLLLDAGADPNTPTWFEGETPGPLSALYRACENDCVPLVRLLLERGARPDDDESIYHAAEKNRRECLELLFAHGVRVNGRPDSPWGNTPLFFIAGYRETDENVGPATEGMRWLLEHGADPNLPSGDERETPLHRMTSIGRSPAAIAMLLDHGADPNLPRADGRTAFALAVRAGSEEVAALLMARGANPTAGATDRLLGACMRADAAAARGALAADPDLVARLTPEDRGMVAQAALEDRRDTVLLMASLGLDLGWEHPWAGTALHHAAWRGRGEMTRLLLERGAPVDLRDRQFGSSALGWAAHGSAHCRARDVDHVAVVDALLDAGASAEASVNRWGAGPLAIASPALAAHLRARGWPGV